MTEAKDHLDSLKKKKIMINNIKKTIKNNQK